MPEEIFTLEALAKLKEQEEEEKNKLLFEQYLRNLENMVAENNCKIVDSIDKPKSNQNKEYICIKEPLEFIDLFQQCSGQQECIELFVNLLSKKDCRVIDQIISEKEKIEELWFNSTKNGINLRPGLKDEEWSSPMAITLGDDSVHGLVAGRTGSGKSVFLNNMIFSLMAEYSPWELNIFLADFKRVEFSRYLSKYEVPHIKAVAATSEIHCRYQNVYAVYKELHISSIYAPEQIYESIVSYENRKTDNIEQLLRRISLYVYHYKENNEYKTFELSGEQYNGYEDLKQKALGRNWTFEKIKSEDIPKEWRNQNE